MNVHAFTLLWLYVNVTFRFFFWTNRLSFRIMKRRLDNWAERVYKKPQKVQYLDTESSSSEDERSKQTSEKTTASAVVNREKLLSPACECSFCEKQRRIKSRLRRPLNLYFK